MKKMFVVFGLLIIILFLSSCVTKEVTVEESSVCELDSDCQFVSFVGSCNTPQYVSQVMEKCQDGSGPCPSTPPGNPLNENVRCACENYVCVTYR